MVSRPTLIKYGTLALILFFVGSSLYPLLYAADNTEATPTPDASALSFTAGAQTQARVVGFGFTGVAFCSADVLPVERVKALSNVSNAFYASQALLAVQMEPGSDLSALSDLVASACQASLFRSAFLDLPSVSLNTSSGTQLLSSRQMQAFAQSQGLPGVQGFISAQTPLNATVNATLEVVVQNNLIASLAVQEVADSFVPVSGSQDGFEASNESAASNTSDENKSADVLASDGVPAGGNASNATVSDAS